MNKFPTVRTVISTVLILFNACLMPICRKLSYINPTFFNCSEAVAFIVAEIFTIYLTYLIVHWHSRRYICES